jgi:hypothetical protein
VTTDPLTRVRDHLAVARECLVAAGKPVTSAVIARLETIERQLDPAGADWRHPQTARRDLERIAEYLRKLTATAKLTQDPTNVLLPGVDGALEQIKSAVDLLEG